MNMIVRVILPSGILLEQEVSKVVAEAQDGSFCLLPRHIDFAAALVPGILALEEANGEETFFAVDEGILVKRGAEVLVSTGNAVKGRLGELRHVVSAEFRVTDDRERQARLALDHLEASLVRQIFEWEGRGHA